MLLSLTFLFVLGITGTALAAPPVDFSGEFRFQARGIDDQLDKTVAPAFKKNYFEFRALLNFSAKIDDDATFFGRFSVRNAEGMGQEVRSTNEFDQFGVKGKMGDVKYSVGRQALTVGAGSLLDIGSDSAGATNFFDGVILSGKMGNVDVRAFGGKNNSNIMDTSTGARFANTVNPINEWYGVELSTKAGETPVGFAYLHKKPETGSSLRAVNYWALNSSYTISPKFTLAGEYAKSNASSLNKGYFFAGTYSWAKDSFTVQYNRVEDNAVDGWNGGIGSGPYPFKGKDLTAGYKGFTYAFNHPITKTVSFHAIYMDLQALNKTATTSGSDREFATGITWKF